MRKRTTTFKAKVAIVVHEFEKENAPDLTRLLNNWIVERCRGIL